MIRQLLLQVNNRYAFSKLVLVPSFSGQKWHFWASNHAWTTADWVGSNTEPIQCINVENIMLPFPENKCWIWFSEPVTSITMWKCQQSHSVILLTNLKEVLNLTSCGAPLIFFTIILPSMLKLENRGRGGEIIIKPQKMLMLKGHDPQIPHEQHRSHRHLWFLLVTWSRVSAIMHLCWLASFPFPSLPVPSPTWPPGSPEGASIPCPRQKARAWTSVPPWNGIFTHGMLIFNFIHATHIK